MSVRKAGYEVTIVPYKGPRSGGPWLIRCHHEGGEHVHSAEGGVPLEVGLREVERAIKAHQLDCCVFCGNPGEMHPSVCPSAEGQ